MLRYLGAGMTIRSCALGLVSVVAVLLRARVASSATKTVQVGPGGALIFSPAMLTVTIASLLALDQPG